MTDNFIFESAKSSDTIWKGPCTPQLGENGGVLGSRHGLRRAGELEMSLERMWTLAGV